MMRGRLLASSGTMLSYQSISMVLQRHKKVRTAVTWVFPELTLMSVFFHCSRGLNLHQYNPCYMIFLPCVVNCSIYNLLSYPKSYAYINMFLEEY